MRVASRAALWALLATSPLLAAQSQQPRGTAEIAGTVKNIVTGQPIPAASIMVRPLLGGQPASARADARGHFEVKGLAAGRYRLIATASGFVGNEANALPNQGGTVVTVGDGEALQTAIVWLATPSAIAGRVLDEFGDPVPSAQVQVTHLELVSGRTRLLPVSTAGTSDDLGRFRVSGLSPGDYYVLALSGPFGTNGAAPIMSGSGSGYTGFAPTYFAGTANAAEARPVHVVAGIDTADVVFSLAPVPLVTFTGHVSNPAGPAASATLTLLQTQGGDVRAIIPASTVSAPDGSFTFRAVPTGTYVLQGSSGTLFGSCPVTVVDGGTPDVRLALHGPRTARGRITFDGDPAGVQKAQVRLAFLQTDISTGPLGGLARPPVVMNDDWTFEYPGLQGAGLMRAALPAPWRLKAVRRDGEDITDVVYDFSAADVNGLEIVLTNRSGAVSGTVSDGQGAATDYEVIVFPIDDSKWASPSRFVFTARPGAQGRFAITGLPGASYLAVAVPSASWRDLQPESLSKLRGRATSFSVSDGTSVTLTLTLVKVP